jgi:hypothetical protein
VPSSGELVAAADGEPQVGDLTRGRDQRAFEGDRDGVRLMRRRLRKAWRTSTRRCARIWTSGSVGCCWARRPGSWGGAVSPRSRRRPGCIRTRSREELGELDGAPTPRRRVRPPVHAQLHCAGGPGRRVGDCQAGERLRPSRPHRPATSPNSRIDNNLLLAGALLLHADETWRVTMLLCPR